MSDYLDRLEQVKESKVKVNKIEARLDAFSKIEHIDQIQNELLPQVEEVGAQIDDFLAKISDI